MSLRFICMTLVFLLGMATTGQGQNLSPMPENLYSGLECLLSLPKSQSTLTPEQVNELVEFVRTSPAGASLSLKDRNGASGAMHCFSVRGDLNRVIEYVYNPDVPVYVTMPSSVRSQKWLTQDVPAALKSLTQADISAVKMIRGSEQEIITPDANTGGYYSYKQDRVIAVLPGSTGPVLISVSSQTTPSEVGKKGCVVGNDQDWNYLYSDEVGLNKGGLGWVDSYMYNAHSVIVYVADTDAKTVHIGSFKWLNAGWAKMNMVKSVHILNGIKRFAADFKTVLESPKMPSAQEVAAKYKALSKDSADDLRQKVSPYVQAISQSVDADPFKSLLASGAYLANMGHDEMVKVLLQEYIKGRLGKGTLVPTAVSSLQ